MRKLLHLSLALAALSMAGCATSPVSESAAKPVPSDRVAGYQVARGPHGDITVTRDSGFMGSACFLTVFVNGNEAARLGTAEKVTLQLAPGRWNLGAGFSSAICGAESSRRAVQVIVEAGDQLHYRLATTQDSISIVATD